VSYLAELDGCYTLKTDVPVQVADKELIHDRYKDLAMVESAFRTCKTSKRQPKIDPLRQPNFDPLEF
jgi:hypothetical protein